LPEKGLIIIISAIFNVTYYFNGLLQCVTFISHYIFSFIETSPRLDDDEEDYHFDFDVDEFAEV